MDKKNIVFFLPNFSYGGAGNSILNICKYLNKKKYKIFVLSINNNFYKNELSKYCQEVVQINAVSTLTSLNKIRHYLMSKGVKNDYIKDTIDKIREKNEDQDFFSAIKICKKKRIGPSRDENNRPLFFKKDIGILARSGFDFETSKKVLNLEKDEYLKIINLL